MPSAAVMGRCFPCKLPGKSFQNSGSVHSRSGTFELTVSIVWLGAASGALFFTMTPLLLWSLTSDSRAASSCTGKYRIYAVFKWKEMENAQLSDNEEITAL